MLLLVIFVYAALFNTQKIKLIDFFLFTLSRTDQVTYILFHLFH